MTPCSRNGTSRRRRRRASRAGGVEDAAARSAEQRRQRSPVSAAAARDRARSREPLVGDVHGPRVKLVPRSSGIRITAASTSSSVDDRSRAPRASSRARGSGRTSARSRTGRAAGARPGARRRAPARARRRAPSPARAAARSGRRRRAGRRARRAAPLVRAQGRGRRGSGEQADRLVADDERQRERGSIPASVDLRPDRRRAARRSRRPRPRRRRGPGASPSARSSSRQPPLVRPATPAAAAARRPSSREVDGDALGAEQLPRADGRLERVGERQPAIAWPTTASSARVRSSSNACLAPGRPPQGVRRADGEARELGEARRLAEPPGCEAKLERAERRLAELQRDELVPSRRRRRTASRAMLVDGRPGGALQIASGSSAPCAPSSSAHRSRSRQRQRSVGADAVAARRASARSPRAPRLPRRERVARDVERPPGRARPQRRRRAPRRAARPGRRELATRVASRRTARRRQQLERAGDAVGVERDGEADGVGVRAARARAPTAVSSDPAAEAFDLGGDAPTRRPDERAATSGRRGRAAQTTAISAPVPGLRPRRSSQDRVERPSVREAGWPARARRARQRRRRECRSSV